MALDSGARTQAIYNAVAAANPALTGSHVSDAERAQVKAQLAAMFGADTSYLTGNAVILPGTMVAPAGATVQVAYPAGTGATTGPSPTVTGAGRLT